MEILLSGLVMVVRGRHANGSALRPPMLASFRRRYVTDRRYLRKSSDAIEAKAMGIPFL
jgi:hypothetical protein